MNSKVFFNEFLKYETDSDILKTQYVVVSTRIRKTSNDNQYNNILIATNYLFPDNIGIDDEHFEENYYNQLECNKPLLATLVLGVIEKNYNIVFLCTKAEDKLHYLKYLERFILNEFDFPVYNYHKLRNNKISLIDYNKKYVVNLCNEILKNASNDQIRIHGITKKQIKANVREFKNLGKKKMKKELIKRNLYTDGMSRKEMLEVYELFIQ